MISEEERQKRSARMSELHAKKREEKQAKEEEFVAEAPMARSETDRPRRNLFNGQNARLNVAANIPGYHLHWFNDAPGRIEQALESGYNYVTRDEVRLSASRRVTELNASLSDTVEVVTTDDPSAKHQKSVLMKIREEYYMEDQKEVQDQIDQDERSAIKNNGYAPVSNTYLPKGSSGLTINHRKG